MTIRRLLFTLLLAASAATMSANDGAPAPDNKGTDFILAFPQNVNTPPTATHRLTLFIAADEATWVEISGPLVIPKTVSIPAASVLEVFFDTTSLQVSPNAVGDNGIHVRSILDPANPTVEGAPVAVYALNRRMGSAGAYLALPVDVLGTQYRALSRPGTSQVTVVGTHPDTVVSITQYATVSGVTTVSAPFTVLLNSLQTYLVQDLAADLTGTLVTANHPIAVYSGNQIAGVNGGSTDHMIEQLVPVSDWGNEFIVTPVLPAITADVVRVLAHEPDTAVDINDVRQAILGAGQFHEFAQPAGAGSWIKTTKPALVAFYNRGDSPATDTFVMLVPPVGQFSHRHLFKTPGASLLGAVAFSNRLNIVVKDGDEVGLELNGGPLPADTVWTWINGHRYARVSIDPARSYSLQHREPSVPIGAWVYGQAMGEGYGYAAGQLVEDTTLPELFSVPDDQTIEATGPDGAAAAWDDPIAADFGRGEIEAECGPSSGSVFPLGTTIVTCRAIDPAGNEATASFTVTVVDTTPPRLTVPADITVRPTSPQGANPALASAQGTAVTFEVTATDLVDPNVSVVCTPPSGSPFAPGRTTVTCTATDTSGNSSDGWFSVSVINGAPICSAAVASAPLLWPPNHDLVPITIRDVTDPDGDRVSIHIDSVFQDEPTNSTGDGNTVVDGFGIGHIAMVRAERNARGDGRVYHIGFTAFDAYGASCRGTVTVGVPRTPNLPPVDQGAIYDSSARLPDWAQERLHRLIRRLLSMD